MNTETLNQSIFADLVTQWATQIAMARAPSTAGNATFLDAAAVTTEELRMALAQIQLRRDVVKALREGMASAAPAR